MRNDMRENKENKERKESIGAVITAAGLSSRMGRFKPLLKIGGISAAERIISNFHLAGIEDVVVVTGKNAGELESELGHLGVKFLRNERYEYTEMFDSIKIGLRCFKDICSKVFLTPVDVPMFRPETVKELLKCSADIGVPVFGGKMGHPVILDKKAIEGVLGYSGSGGLKAAISSLSFETEYIESGDSGILYEMDTIEDYERIIANVFLNHDSPSR